MVFEGENQGMRALAGLLAAAALLAGVYYGYLKSLPVSDHRAAPAQAISLTAVRSDLLQIAQAERAFIAANGNCVPLGELLSGNTLAMAKTGRDGYSYSVECSGGEFNAIARHAEGPPGSSLRYPSLAVDQSMQVHEIN